MMSSTRYILVLSLGAMVLLGSTGLMVDHHYCQGELQHSSLMKKAASCHEKETCHKAETGPSKSCCSKVSESEKEDGCCDNESEFVQVDLDYPCLDSDLESKVIAIDCSILEMVQTPLNKRNEALVRFINHIPPPIIADPQIDYQVFRC